ncbi:MAG: NAD(P)/FAD-dependent oxidoreductase [Candidatus Eremiobacteraeota bacterium]|nr:NAD(P)/FAD-dependent oxidoreductase [Candidatus Eremiobacteraeota bacterium]
MESVEFLVVGCGPAGGTAAREAARGGIETLVLERDKVVGAKRVCAAGLRPGFCENFNLPRSIVHCDPPTIALHSPTAERYEFTVGPAHTTTREELDGTIADLARREGAQIRTHALYRMPVRDGDRVVVEYADLVAGERRKVAARAVFLAQGATARLEETSFDYADWRGGLITCVQYRVYLDRPATAETYATLEMHYYTSPCSGRPIIAWMFPKRDHLSVGLGIQAKVPGIELRAELDAFVPGVLQRLAPSASYTLKEEGSLLYGGAPRPRIADETAMVGGTAAGLVDATTGEGIHEAATSGRVAAEAIATARRAARFNPGELYRRAITRAFYGRLHHRHKLMRFLERKPARFDVLFTQLAGNPRFAELLQHDRNDFTPMQWAYLYRQAAAFSLRALRV